MTTRDRAIDSALWASWAASLGGIVLGSLGTAPGILSAVPNGDKVLHFVSYFTLAVLFLLAAVWRPGRGAGRYPTSGKVVIAGVVALGALLEVAQGMFFDRTSDFVDAAMNLFGAASALWAWSLLQPVGRDA